MRTLLWLFALAALAIGIALLGELSNGYVLWVIPPWRIEMSFNLYVLAQLVALALAYLALRAILVALDMPRVVADYRARRAKARDEWHAIAALRQFWEGRYAQALKSAEKVAAGKTAAAGIAALVALKAAHALRDERRIAEWQARAEGLDDSWLTARRMVQIRIALDGRDFSAARRALEALSPQERRRISTQRLALRLAQGQREWTELLRLTRLLEKHRALTPDQALPLRLSAQRGLIDAARDDPAQLMRKWRSMAADERSDARLARQAAQALAAAGACDACAELVEEFLASAWEPALLAPYAQCANGDALGRIARCEQWLLEHPNDADLLLALGRLCARQQLWGKAQSYLEASLAVASSCAAHIELARLFDRLERPDAANRHYRLAADCQEAAGRSRGDDVCLQPPR